MDLLQRSFQHTLSRTVYYSALSVVVHLCAYLPCIV